MKALWQQVAASLGSSKDGYKEYCRSLTSETNCRLSGCSWSGGSVTTGDLCHPNLWVEELNNRNPDLWKVFLEPPPEAWGQVEEPEHWRKRN